MKCLRVLSAAVLVLATGCGESATGETESKHSPKLSPKLFNLLVAFEDCPTDPCTAGRGGAFLFSQTGDAPLLFGSRVEGPEGMKTLPNLELRVARDAEVLSPVDGTVEVLQIHEGAGDYTLRMSFGEDTVEIDHLLAPTIAQGDVIHAGQVLGTPGNWSGELGRVELQVNHGRDYACPMDYLDPSVATALTAKVSALMQDWEEVTGKPDLYDQAAMVTPGCLKHSYKDAEL